MNPFVCKKGKHRAEASRNLMSESLHRMGYQVYSKPLCNAEWAQHGCCRRFTGGCAKCQHQDAEDYSVIKDAVEATEEVLKSAESEWIEAQVEARGPDKYAE